MFASSKHARALKGVALLLLAFMAAAAMHELALAFPSCHQASEGVPLPASSHHKDSCAFCTIASTTTLLSESVGVPRMDAETVPYTESLPNLCWWDFSRSPLTRRGPPSKTAQA